MVEVQSKPVGQDGVEKSGTKPDGVGAPTVRARRPVLLCDDDAALLRTLGLALKRSGRDVLAVSNGREAIDALGTQSFQCVVTDIVMPEMEGLELIRRIRHERPFVPIVAMSGGGKGYGAEYLSMAKLLGAIYTLGKPFRFDQLLAILDEVDRALDSDGE